MNQYYKDDENLIQLPISNSTDRTIPIKKSLALHLTFRLAASACLYCYNLEIIKEIKFDEGIHTLEDWEYVFQVLLNIENLGVFEYAFYHYRTNIGSSSLSGLSEKKMTCFIIPEKVRNQLIACNLKEMLVYADGLEIVLICQLLKIETSKSSTIYDEEIKNIARKNMLKTIRSQCILKRHKAYCLMIIVHPVVFRKLHRIKYKCKKCLQRKGNIYGKPQKNFIY